MPASLHSTLLGESRMRSDDEVRVCDEIAPFVGAYVDKSSYGCDRRELSDAISREAGGILPRVAFVAGVNTDCCVLATSILLFDMGIRPVVLADYCASNAGEAAHEAGLACMGRLVGQRQMMRGEVTQESQLWLV